VKAKQEDTKREMERRRALANIIQQQLSRRGLSVRAAARKSGISFSHFAKIVRCEVSLPTPPTIEKIALGLGLPFSQLFCICGWQSDSAAPPNEVFTRLAGGDPVKFALFMRVFAESENLALPPGEISSSPTLPVVQDSTVKFLRRAARGSDSFAWAELFLSEDLGLPAGAEAVYLIAEKNHRLHRLDFYLYMFNLIPAQYLSPEYTPFFARWMSRLREIVRETIESFPDSVQDEAGFREFLKRLNTSLEKRWRRIDLLAEVVEAADPEAVRMSASPKGSIGSMLLAALREVKIAVDDLKTPKPPAGPQYKVTPAGEWTTITITIPTEAADFLVPQIAALFRDALARAPRKKS